MNKKRPDISVAPHISVAPMMDWTDRHCRVFHRLITPHVRLYTEMITTGAILFGEKDRFLRYGPTDHPVTLQLGGSSPEALAECAKIGEDYGYDEINLNCGCPSGRVQNASFGVCLMHRPDYVADCIGKMINAVSIPVTVKCRIGIDDSDDFPFLNKFVGAASNAGCKEFTIHARKALLNGIDPKQNREIPPLRYDIAAQIKDEYPDLRFILNGGIKTIDDMRAHLKTFDGIMIGREFYQNPYILADVERELFGNKAVLPREAVARAMIPYIEQQQKDYNTPVNSVTRHMMGLFQGLPGGKIWRRTLSTEVCKPGATAHIIEEALAQRRQATEDLYERRTAAAC